MVTSAETLFTLLGQLQPRLHNIPLSMPKYKESEGPCVHRQLDIHINTLELTTGVPDDKRDALEHTLRTTWYP